MNLSPEWVPFLEQTGFACVHWSAVGNPGASDAELMAWAREHDHVVFTHDMDFGALLAATRAVGPSVLQARVKDTMPSALGRTYSGFFTCGERRWCEVRSLRSTRLTREYGCFPFAPTTSPPNLIRSADNEFQP
jgi:predicted nuclease of predicted toxin-antitoxin system